MRIALLFLLMTSPCLLAAEAPKITRLSPPGMQLGTTAEVKLVGKPGDGKLQLDLESEQLTFEFSEKMDAATVTATENATPGIHWLRFFNEFGATELLPFFVGTVPELSENEPNQEYSTAQAIEGSAVVINGVLDKSADVDVFAVPLKAGQTLVASVMANRELGSPMDAVLQLLDPNGTVLIHNDDDHDFDPQIAFTATSDGTYYVRIFAFPAAPNSTIRLANGADYVYRLTLTTEPFVDYTVPLQVSADEQTVSLHGWNLKETDSKVSATDQPFVLTGISNVFTIGRCAETSLPESEAASQMLNLPCQVTGVIETEKHVDKFQFQATKGERWTFQVLARQYHSLLDPVIIVTDSDGTVLKESDDRDRTDRDAEALVTIKKDGVHEISIRDRFAHGGERYFYLLSGVKTDPDFKLTLKATHYELETKPLEIPVEIERLNAFNEKITVQVSQLPERVSVEPVVSEPKGDTSKSVTLKLTRADGAQPFSGTIQISCESESKVQRAALAPIPNSHLTRSTLWLTILPDAEKQ